VNGTASPIRATVFCTDEVVTRLVCRFFFFVKAPKSPFFFYSLLHERTLAWLQNMFQFQFFSFPKFILLASPDTLMFFSTWPLAQGLSDPSFSVMLQSWFRPNSFWNLFMIRSPLLVLINESVIFKDHPGPPPQETRFVLDVACGRSFSGSLT